MITTKFKTSSKMYLKGALGLDSHFLLSFLEKPFTVFCESLIVVVTDHLLSE